ncbi:dipeptide ABC transporter ATP-binding protein [Paeniglutamicibacter cryotolerans]|uniref:Peptide/nickel transport system ATP-binding protein n=1 Tax=Paeniglutamicibacter cryotolerans TaxID=670079 RepID=A0A839QTJ1_9MICC|nr:ABC transporter ATP-binding protein [Paeniglutamicibacter cryotolerans]MBB2995351.1 peptide/nickel transport system ATP-binding protein [Paeniglutamicibacter cryotolerans]
MTLLEIDDLVLDLKNGLRLLNGVSLSVTAGETVALVGESGSGKSLTSRTVLGLFPEKASMTGSIMLDGVQMLGATTRETTRQRRNTVSMVFQDPRSGINPVRTIGDFLTESLVACQGWNPAEARKKAIELLASVGLPRPETHMRQYPYELSGGMLQRVMIAGAMGSSPKLLVYDEPTSALDVTTQAEIIGVLRKQQRENNTGMLFITHDLNLAAALCDRVYVIHRGEIVEQGNAAEVFADPQHDYTRRLVAATPRIGDKQEGRVVAPTASAITEPVIQVSNLEKAYMIRHADPVRAVNSVTFEVQAGGSLALVGESGSGKSTIARMLVGLEEPDSGSILINGAPRPAGRMDKEARLAQARSAQIVFQDPYLSLDPRITAGGAIEDALRLHGKLGKADARKRVLTLLEQVGLSERIAQSRPRTLSGGQRQRVAIARALAVEPKILVLDEATSALDVSVQSQVLDLIDAIRAETGLTIVFVSHDLAVVRRVCEDAVVLKAGAAVEVGKTAQLLDDPQHPYTRLLVDSIPRPGWRILQPQG